MGAQELIIFLDIDGPMIPTREYLFNPHASIDQNLNVECLRVLRHVLEKTGARIVFNTTHNRNGERLVSRFKEAGFTQPADIHEDCHTLYPDIDRLTAIREWLGRHPEVEKWVAFDDCPIKDSRAYPTDADHGIGWNEYQHAAQHLLGQKPGVILL